MLAECRHPGSIGRDLDPLRSAGRISACRANTAAAAAAGGAARTPSRRIERAAACETFRSCRSETPVAGAMMGFAVSFYDEPYPVARGLHPAALEIERAGRPGACCTCSPRAANRHTSIEQLEHSRPSRRLRLTAPSRRTTSPVPAAQAESGELAIAALTTRRWVVHRISRRMRGVGHRHERAVRCDGRESCD